VSQRLPDIRRVSLRVALRATALVAAIYLVAAVAVVAVTTGNLTRQIDDRLTSFLSGDPMQPPRHEPGGGPGERPFGPPTLTWRIDASGNITYGGPTDYALELPAQFASISSPQTVTIDDHPFRMAGRQVGDDYVVVAQEMESVSDAQSTLVLAELVIGPILLGVVFVGAVLIGRRAATPFELARQRQMEFTADASHELRTPLSVIEAQTSLALAQERPAAWYRTAFGRVDAESKRMRRLIEDMLWLARFDATAAAPNAEPVDLGILAAQAADRFGVIAEARHLDLTVSGADAGAVVAASPEWLDRLLGVLLDNACKYSREGGSVSVAVSVDGQRIRLTVDDDGPGIPEGERQRIFDRFHRAQVEGAGGAGLGLAIADAIVRATGGRWQVGESPLGGARMSVTWPSAFGGRRSAASVISQQPETARGD
jgi:two-component system sensor histidine kinase CiaH